jgi:hypothetical protein
MLRDMEKARGGGDQRSDHPYRMGRGDPKPIADLGIAICWIGSPKPSCPRGPIPKALIGGLVRDLTGGGSDL